MNRAQAKEEQALSDASTFPELKPDTDSSGVVSATRRQIILANQKSRGRRLFEILFPNIARGEGRKAGTAAAVEFGLEPRVSLSPPLNVVWKGQGPAAPASRGTRAQSRSKPVHENVAAART